MQLGELPYSVRLKMKFILTYGLIGLTSTLVLLVFFLINKEYLHGVFYYTVIVAIPTLALTAYFAWKAKPVQASTLALFSMFLGCIASLTLEFASFLAFILIFVLSILFISIKRWQWPVGIIILLTTSMMKILIESGYLFSEVYTNPKMKFDSLFFSGLFLLSILTYTWMISIFLNKGFEHTEKLFETSEKLKETMSVKDRFFSMIAHDLRGPIGTTAKMLDALYKGKIEARKESLKELRNSSQNTYVLLENLLSWFKAQQNDLQINPEHFNISSCINTTLELHNSSAKLKEIEFVNLGDTDITVFADRSMICTVFRNILNNAIKFSHKGGKIEISVEKNKKHAKIHVKDFGVGIPNEQFSHLFSNENGRASKNGTFNEKGTGMGLLLSKEFVEANKGEIGAESKLNEGSLFWFTVPIPSDESLSNN